VTLHVERLSSQADAVDEQFNRLAIAERPDIDRLAGC
jgi:hypothetical protein